MSVIDGATCYQADATAGPPLDVVGPSGSYYSFGQPRSLLISAHNGGTTPCQIPPCPYDETIPLPALACDRLAPAPTTTTAPDEVTTTTVEQATTTTAPSGIGQTTTTLAAAPTTTLAAAPTTTAPCPAGQVMRDGRCVAATLPATGSRPTTLPGLLLGAALALTGAALVLWSARAGRRATH
jgi:hypothetical protein